jgi:pimeloyl-ACP methyl ester carboxylesterase
MQITVTALVIMALVGCGGSNPSRSSPDMAPSLSLGPAPQLAVACRDTLADIYNNLPSNLPPMDNTHRGDVFHCALGESLSAAYANTQAKSFGYPGPPLASGFWTYRLAFRSLRNTPATGTPAEGDMAAVLMVPEKPLAGAPLVVLAHPTMGLGSGCGPSHVNLADPKAASDYSSATLPLAAYGYTVIVPDYAGFSYGQAPGYFNAEDEAHAVLDATRAAKQVLPASRAFDKVVFVGHSQGGHAALAAEAIANSYGYEGKLIGVATWAPFWTSMAIWGAVPTPLANFSTSNMDQAFAILFSMFYFYSANELRDGPGTGTSMFQPAMQVSAKNVVLSESCYDIQDLKAMGSTPGDFYDPTFVMQVGSDCATGTDCTQGTAPKWLARWQEDRPHLDPNGPPVLIWYGGQDTFVLPGFAQCAIDRISKDFGSAGASASLSVCYDATSPHRPLAHAHVDYVNQWIAARAGLGAEPAACPNFPTGLICQQPPNDY